MSGTFINNPTRIIDGELRSAVISDDGRYRYLLTRIWSFRNRKKVLFIGLNPSTADGVKDDSTIRKCRKFAQGWGCGGMWMCNLFAYRTTYPELLKRAAEPIGKYNDQILINYIEDANLVVAAWGVHGSFLNRDKAVMEMYDSFWCFGKTKKGQPKHPLYLKADTQLEPFMP